MNTKANSDERHGLDGAAAHETKSREVEPREATTHDGYRVALIKSLTTNNRFLRAGFTRVGYSERGCH
jgi:hypothetical protein